MLLTDLTFHEAASKEEIENCWQVSVQNILDGCMEEAQASLLLPFLGVESAEEEEFLQHSLVEYLQAVADRQEIENACKIISFIQDLFPNHLNNLLHLITLSVRAEIFGFEMLVERHLLELLADTEADSIDQIKLYEVVQISMQLFNIQHVELLPETFFPDLVTSFIGKTDRKNEAWAMIAQEAFLLGHQRSLQDLTVKILQVCLELCESELRFDVLCQLSIAMATSGQYAQSIQLARELYAESHHQSELHAVIAGHHLLHCLLEAGEWQKVSGIAAQHQQDINNLITMGCQAPNNLGMLISSGFFLNYVLDQPRVLHDLRNGLGQICSQFAQKKAAAIIPAKSRARASSNKKVLNIGYIASTLSEHPVGWLSRWLFAHHNSQDFQIFIYNIGQDDQNGFNEKFFREKAHWSHYFGVGVAAIVVQIQKDEIDILVDLDSLTFSTTYEVLCCKPAPIQLTWLGWDASGCPEIDYFIADPYVLPEDAEEYYQPNIWRLPHTYLAVDGFEVGIPTKRREDYDIPSDAVVYLCGQKSFKHNPEILHLQMQIIQEVPNSYLLVKLRGDRDSLMSIYQTLANEVGIGMDRLRFIDSDPDEYTHRANLNIADVVLDTFPYSGATTTLETIWAGVPMVTKVGQSFVSRNSYAFLTNAGISEGIAHTDEEYVAWGIKLGTSLELRQQVSGKMIHSRKTAPLWNAKQFTAEMEDAYRGMWKIHQEQELIHPELNSPIGVCL
jgi:predicted O-linked N-acetylglucosamine transferase (SPINDLY family)